MKRPLTPKQKKAFSYAKDGRNTVAESRSKAHKGISKRKADANRALRRAARVAAAKATKDDSVDVSVARAGRRSFRKIPDAPLAEYVSARLRRRKKSGMNKPDKESSAAKTVRARSPKRPLKFKGPLQ